MRTTDVILRITWDDSVPYSAHPSKWAWEEIMDNGAWRPGESILLVWTFEDQPPTGQEHTP